MAFDENLTHALANDCKDPDCEIHNPRLAFDEEVIGKTELAFFYAGACALAKLLSINVSAYDLGDALWKLRQNHKLEEVS